MSDTYSTSSSIEQVFHHFGQPRSALDYAFFKLNLPEHEVALQVDFIVRRRGGISQLRVSTYAPTGTGVSFAEIPLDHLVIGSQPCQIGVRLSATTGWMPLDRAARWTILPGT